jgi:hypothetical protein
MPRRPGPRLLAPPVPILASQRLSLAALVAIYLASRLYAVTHLPVFLDEAIHMYGARGGLTDAGQLFNGRWLTRSSRAAGASGLTTARVV